MNSVANKPKRVLICGATGYLGRYLVRSAHEAGHWVRALVRKPDGLGENRKLCDDVFVGQATEPTTLAGMCDDIDVVISSLGNRTVKRKPTFWDVDYAANMNIVERATKAKVEQFIFVSVLHGDVTRSEIPQVEAREQVADALKKTDLHWTIERPSGFFNDMSEFFNMARDRGSVWIFGDGKVAFNPIHGADLADAIVSHVGDENAYGKEYPEGGPEVLTLRQIAELACEAAGKAPKIRSVPMWVLGAAATVITPFNGNVGSLLSMFHAMATTDAVTERYGTHHLADFYRELAAGD